MLAVPGLTPVIWGCATGVVWPAAMTTVAGEMVRVLVSLLDRVTVTAEGAACGRVTANAVELPIPTVGLEGTPIVPAVATVMLAVVLGRFGAAVLAVMVLAPNPTPVTTTLAEVAPVAKLTLAGTVATVGVPELRFTVKPPAGAGPERLRARV